MWAFTDALAPGLQMSGGGLVRVHFSFSLVLADSQGSDASPATHLGLGKLTFLSQFSHL